MVTSPHRLSAPPGVRAHTWWTVEARAPEPAPVVEKDQERALSILVKIVGMHLPEAWKSMQLVRGVGNVGKCGEVWVSL